MSVLMNFFGQFIIHIVITASGMLFVDVEVLREGNDALLNGLD